MTLLQLRDKLTSAVENLLNPLDGFTLAHGFTGLILARIKLNRYLYYPIPIIWEVYQYFFHYHPQNYTVRDIWINSLADILFCVCCYEVSKKYLNMYNRCPLGFKINSNFKIATVYFIITCGFAWLFWDDLIRGKFVENIPLPQIPLILGALAPLIAAFIIRTRIISTEPEDNNLFFLRSDSRLYYLTIGLLPTAVITLTVFLISTGI